jgi:hypothetical protein
MNGKPYPRVSSSIAKQHACMHATYGETESSGFPSPHQKQHQVNIKKTTTNIQMPKTLSTHHLVYLIWQTPKRNTLNTIVSHHENGTKFKNILSSCQSLGQSSCWCSGNNSHIDGDDELTLSLPWNYVFPFSLYIYRCLFPFPFIYTRKKEKASADLFGFWIDCV